MLEAFHSCFIFTSLFTLSIRRRKTREFAERGVEVPGREGRGIHQGKRCVYLVDEKREFAGAGDKRVLQGEGETALTQLVHQCKG